MIRLLRSWLRDLIREEVRAALKNPAPAQVPQRARPFAQRGVVPANDHSPAPKP